MVRWLKTVGSGIHRQLKKRLKHLEKEILKVQAYLKQFEEGNLICAKNGKHFKWYHTDGTNQTYIPKDQRKFAEQLAIKKYYTMILNDMEKMIASYLYIKKIPFRYECALYLNGVLVFPDFTIRHPKTGEVYYWEHFGLMDQPSYVKRTMEKMQNYTLNGIIPSIHLITTYETKDHPLSTMEVEEIVEKYFG